MNVDRCLEIATRAVELAGLTGNGPRFYALLAVADALIEAAETRRVAAQYADTAAYRRQDLEAADRLEQMALDLRRQANALEESTGSERGRESNA